MNLLTPSLPQILLPNGVRADFELVSLSARIERVAARNGFTVPWEPAQQIAAGIEDYLRCEYPEPTISLQETAALTAKALFNLGFPDLANHFARQAIPKPVVIDLREIAGLSGDLHELSFFPTLRQQLQSALEERNHDDTLPNRAVPIHLCGMRQCVKSLLSAKRWSRRCAGLNEEIVNLVEEIITQDGRTGTRVALTAN